MLPPKIKPQKPSADQRRYDNLASRTNVSPSQQRLMDRLGKKLGIGAPNIRLPSIPGNFDPDREGLYPGPRVRGGPADPPVSRPPMPGPGVGFDADRAYPGPRVRGGPIDPPVSRPPTGGPMNPGPMPPPQRPSNFGDGRDYFIPDAPLPPGMFGTMGGTGYDPKTGRMDLGTAGGSGQFVSNPPGTGGIGGATGTGGISTGYNTGMPATNTYQNTGGFGSPTGSPTNFFNTQTNPSPFGGAFKKGGAVKAKKMASGGMTAKASPARRGDGIAQRGKTKGRMV